MAEGARWSVSRRSFLGATVGAVVLPTAACGIRLEDDAPRVPLVPTRTPLAAEARLVDLTRDTAVLATWADALAGELPAALATIHRRQHAVLRTTLLRGQVPSSSVDGTTTPAPTPTLAPTGGRAALAAAEAAAAASAGSLAGVASELRATVAALHAQRYAAVSLLTGRPPVVPREPVADGAVRELATGTSAAVWFLEVVSARSTGRQRSRSDTTLETLRDLLTDQVAGGSTPVAVLGHPLPFPVDSPRDAARLAREVLTSLRAGFGEHLEPLVTAHRAAGMDAVTRWLGTVETEAHRWGVDLAPFPGLT
jgi:hypothetical protein